MKQPLTLEQLEAGVTSVRARLQQLIALCAEYPGDPAYHDAEDRCRAELAEAEWNLAYAKAYVPSYPDRQFYGI